MPEEWTSPEAGGSSIDPISETDSDHPCDLGDHEPTTSSVSEDSEDRERSTELSQAGAEPDGEHRTDEEGGGEETEVGEGSDVNGAESADDEGDDPTGDETASTAPDTVPEIGDDVAVDDIDVDDEPVILEIDGIEQEETASDTAQEPESEQLAAIREELSSLRAAHEQLREQYLRKLAEFDNYRKRTEREREELERTAGEGVVRELIPVLDNFERALQHSDKSDFAAFRQGVEMIAKQLWDVLGRQGLEEMDPTGQPFQPEYHEAVQRVENADQEPGTVAWVLAKGYLFGGRLIRPAMVGVAVEPSRPEVVSENPETEGGEGLDAS